MSTTYIGRARDRLDGPAKVTGQAKYAGEYAAPDLAYGVVITSDIARGTIRSIDASAALALPGVVAVLSHENVPKLARSDESWTDEVAPPGSPFRPLQSPEVQFSAQPVALVVAETFELARYAAGLVRIEYSVTAHETDFESGRNRDYEPKPRAGIAPPAPPVGDPGGAFERAAVKHDAQYHFPPEHHNPMEPYATTAVRNEDGTLTVYDKTQGVLNVHRYLCSVLGAGEDEIRVIGPFVGGAFGLGLRPRYTALLAALAARELHRSVRVTVTRQQMFGMGFRPMTWQRVALGANDEGNLEAILHHAMSGTSRHEEYTDAIVQWTAGTYKCENIELQHEVVPLDVQTPCDMRAPGAVVGFYAFETALDELAVHLNMDPLELRLRNYADRDSVENKPHTSKELRACYRQAAERFGWSKRDPRPRSMRSGDQLVGWGMATGKWEAMQDEATARAVFTADGRLTVSSGTADIGTGTLTIMTQIAAESFGLPIERVTFQFADSRLPPAPVEGGSFTAASVGNAVKAVCEKLRASVLRAAADVKNSPIADLSPVDAEFADGSIRSRSNPSRTLRLDAILRELGRDSIEETVQTKPDKELEKYARYIHSAVFAEVKVDVDFGTTQVTRIVSAIAAGRIINPKTAHSQVMGAIIWGIGMALQEESVMDNNFGRFMTRNFADYHIPVHADVHDIDIIFVEENDRIINPLGVKGLGEPGLVGVAAAIGNAIYHATGKRIRSLPITPDKLI